MQLYILDKNPILSASLIPDKYKFKMLIELGQLICSAGLSDVYKPIKQGKELQKWVNDNRVYTYHYFNKLLRWSINHIDIKIQSLDNLNKISDDLFNSMHKTPSRHPTHAYFRYSKNYKCDVVSKSLLSIDDCISEYKKYLEWKMGE